MHSRAISDWDGRDRVSDVFAYSWFRGTRKYPIPQSRNILAICILKLNPNVHRISGKKTAEGKSACPLSDDQNSCFLFFAFPSFSSLGECSWVINFEAHAVHCRMANAIFAIDCWAGLRYGREIPVDFVRRIPFVLFYFGFAFGECLWVINVELHAAQYLMANAITILISSRA